MKSTRIISLLGATAMAVLSFGAVGVHAENSYDRYTAAYDYSGRLVAVYKTENADPAESTADFKLFKNFVWDGKNEPYTDENSVVFDSNKYKEIESTETGYQVQVYDDESRTSYSSYEISESAEMYVNGVEASKCMIFNAKELFEGQYVKRNVIGKVRLSETGTPDGIYDAVNVSYYADGAVYDVYSKDGETVIYFDTYDSDIPYGQMVLDGTSEYSIHFNGKEIRPEDIMSGDVLSVAYDVSEPFRNSGSYDIYVSRNCLSGKIESIGDSANPNYAKYEINDGTICKAYDSLISLKEGEVYDLYFDIAGTIVAAKARLGVDKFGLIEDVYTENENAYVDLITGSGKVSYQVDMDECKDFAWILMGYTNEIDMEDKLINRAPLQERVIKYDIDSDGKLIIKNIEKYWTIDGEFNESSLWLSGEQLSPEYTVILDMTDYNTSQVNSGTVRSIDYLKSAVEYEGYSFGAKSGITQFVIITKATPVEIIPSEPWVDPYPWAVVVHSGDSVIEAYVDQELVTMPVKEGVDPGLAAGDVFIYEMNSDGEITEIKPVARMASNYREYYENALNADFDVINKDIDIDEYEIVFGVISEVRSYSNPGAYYLDLVTAESFGKKNQSLSKFNLDYAKEYDFKNDIKVYKYDYSAAEEKDRLTVSNRGSIKRSSFDIRAYVGHKSDGIINFNAEFDYMKESENLNYGNVYFAIAKVVNWDITEILVIAPDNEYE